jgi:cellulase
MRSTLSRLSAALLGATFVSAHGHVSQVTTNGISYYGHDPTKVPWGPQPDSITWSNGAKDNGPVASDASSLASRDINCHLNATNGKLTAHVKAGGEVGITWSDWPESHHGPVLNYMADCGTDCTTVDVDELKWFKVNEMGQLTRSAVSGIPGKWADDLLFETNLTWTVAIPADIKPGNYVLRHELIALHPGGAENSTQMYPQCINLNVTGTGTVSPAGIPGSRLYSSKDPGLLHNIYNDYWVPNVVYVIPGPPVCEY